MEDKIISLLRQKFPEAIINTSVLENSQIKQLTIDIWADYNIDVLTFLANDKDLKYEMIIDVTAADFSKYPNKMPTRFAVVYVLYSLLNNHKIVVRAFIKDDANPEISSVTGIWQGANWPEREVFDMYGIVFKGHPDLKRLLLPEWFEDHPLRKDYPLQGRGERVSFERYERVELFKKEDN